MTPQSNWPDPIPQVGAVLYLDSEIDAPDYTGGKRWKLTGSCVLVAPDRILTVGHTLAARSQIMAPGHYAAFFPYAGLFPIDPNLEWETNQVPGDNLALATLQGPVTHLPPLRPSKISSIYKYSGQAFVCGYGRWTSSPLGDHEGLQQQHLVPLGPPQGRSSPAGWEHYDNLDLSWSSGENSGLTIGRGNSGGPFLWSNDSDQVIGISREVMGDQQVGSWITHNRISWLNSSLPPAGQAPPHLPREWKLLELTEDKEEIAQFGVPEGAQRVRATLNASPGLRLQMEITPPVGGTPQNSTGRFLYRESELPAGTQTVIIRVGRVPRSPYTSGKQVQAQLCVLFE